MAWEQQIEVTRRKPFNHLPWNLAREADFVLDLVTFKVIKHRYGDAHLVDPSDAQIWLTLYLEMPEARILLLTD